MTATNPNGTMEDALRRSSDEVSRLLRENQRIREAAADHGLCTCAGLTGGEGPRPIGGGRFYHYQGCDFDPVLRAALITPDSINPDGR